MSYRPVLEKLEDRLVPAFVASETALTPPTISTSDVEALLDRASKATASNDAIIAVVDRSGHILGVRVEDGVSPAIRLNPEKLDFAVDGAVAEARTAAFFANDTAPLTSRTIQDISQTTITQREVESDPNIADANSTLRGPGYVAPVGVKGHFPPGVSDAPQVDLFAIEHSNRDSLLSPGPDGIKGTADDIPLPSRFNVPSAFIPAGQGMDPPLSYGESLLSPADLINPAVNHFQSRGIGTLPGGIPLFKYHSLVGGIGVFFPGQTGYATEENSSLSATYDPSKPDRTLEAEFMALAATNGSTEAGFPVGALGGIPPVPHYDLPGGRIDLAGITLDVVGPQGDRGPEILVNYAKTNLGVGAGDLGSRTDLPVNPLGATHQLVPTGYLVTPHDGVGITAADVQRIIQQGIDEANRTRAQIRIPDDERARMVFAVADSTGAILGLYRMPDATVFSIDVAVAKARNMAYYDNPALLQPVDQAPGIPRGTAFTSRTIRYLSLPRFPESVDGAPPGPFSILNDPGIDRTTGLDSGAPQPASANQSVLGYDSFHPSTNFRDPVNPANQNGVVFFPGSAGIYKNAVNVGGFGVSGDGVDQDDFVTNSGIVGYGAPDELRADQFFLTGVRLPYAKFPRNPRD